MTNNTTRTNKNNLQIPNTNKQLKRNLKELPTEHIQRHKNKSNNKCTTQQHNTIYQLYKNSHMTQPPPIKKEY